MLLSTLAASKRPRLWAVVHGFSSFPGVLVSAAGLLSRRTEDESRPKREGWKRPCCFAHFELALEGTGRGSITAWRSPRAPLTAVQGGEAPASALHSSARTGQVCIALWGHLPHRQIMLSRMLPRPAAGSGCCLAFRGPARRGRFAPGTDVLAPYRARSAGLRGCGPPAGSGVPDFPPGARPSSQRGSRIVLQAVCVQTRV